LQGKTENRISVVLQVIKDFFLSPYPEVWEK